MKKRLLILTTVATLLLASVSPASAITNGRLDGDDHPYVGLVVSFDAQQNPYVCSGSLIARRLVLTAGHCLDGTEVSFVIFRQEVIPGDLGGAIPGSPRVHPDYDKSPYGSNGLPGVNHRDVGVVLLTEDAGPQRMAKLPSPGRADRLENKHALRFVGFGVTEQARIPGNFLRDAGPYPPPYYRWGGALTRRQARTELVSGKFVQSADVLRLSLNPGLGKGGMCFGDSGGPDLLGGGDVVLGVNSYLTNVNCKGVGYSTRIDVPDVLDWINGFLP